MGATRSRKKICKDDSAASRNDSSLDGRRAKKQDKRLTLVIEVDDTEEGTATEDREPPP